MKKVQHMRPAADTATDRNRKRGITLKAVPFDVPPEPERLISPSYQKRQLDVELDEESDNATS